VGAGSGTGAGGGGCFPQWQFFSQNRGAGRGLGGGPKGGAPACTDGGGKGGGDWGERAILGPTFICCALMWGRARAAWGSDSTSQGGSGGPGPQHLFIFPQNRGAGLFRALHPLGEPPAGIPPGPFWPGGLGPPPFRAAVFCSGALHGLVGVGLGTPQQNGGAQTGPPGGGEGGHDSGSGMGVPSGPGAFRGGLGFWGPQGGG